MSKSTAAMDGNKPKGGSLGLSYPMLAKGNYTAWSMKMRVFILAHGVWDAVEPCDPKGTVEDKMDKVALAMMYQGIPEDLLLDIADKRSAKEAWEAIQTMSQGAERVKKARVQTLKVKFEALNMKDTNVLDEFYMKINRIVSNIRDLGEVVEESYVVKKLLRTVPTKFLQIVSTLEQFGNLDTMTMEEREKDDSKLLLTREEWLKRSNRGSATGAAGTKFRSTQNKSRVKCFNCFGYGHFAAECRKPRRVKEHKLEAYLTQTDDEPALLLAKHDKDVVNNVKIDERGLQPKLLKVNYEEKWESDVWYLDNGASNHMSGQRSKFYELDETITSKVKFGDGSTVEIKGRGSISLNCKNGEERLLREVYFIPSLCSNIISLGQLSEEGNKVILHGEYLKVYDKHQRLLMNVKRSSNRLYRIVIESGKMVCLLSRLEDHLWLWHARLGHVNFPAMVMM
ncbi:uncharacterized protein LOC141714067 [Apium graveolens]|uniref:uncharacterized protein LOC141714067 n=1 Tax=Apium graveolens TaxID=4045 RepID=UPI003D7A0642